MTQVYKATPVQMRKALEAVEHFRKAGIRFVPMPVIDDECYAATVKKMMGRLQTLEEQSK